MSRVQRPVPAGFWPARSFTMSSCSIRPLAGAALVALALAASACSSSTSSSTTTSPTSTTMASASSTTSASTSTSGGTTAPTLPTQTATQGAFYSPTKNISCELNYAGNTGNSAYCFALVPAQNAHMDTTGAVTRCTGETCLSNPGINTPVLPYGTRMVLGPFSCLSAQAGVTCTITSGKGFRISSAGIVDVG